MSKNDIYTAPSLRSEAAGAEVSRGLDDARQALEELEQLERREEMKRQAADFFFHADCGGEVILFL